MLDDEKLAELIEAALPEARNTLLMPGAPRDTLPASIKALMDYIEAEPELSIFNGGVSWALAGGGRIESTHTVLQLLIQALERPAITVVAYLRRYLAATELPVRRRILTCGFTSPQPFNLDASTRFVPWPLVTGGDEILEQEVARHMTVAPLCMIGGVLETGMTIPKVHVPPGAQLPMVKQDLLATDTRRMMMSFQLVCPGGVAGTRVWFELPPWYFGPIQGRFGYPIPEMSSPTKLTDDGIREICDLWPVVRDLPQETFQKYWLATSRLINGESHTFPTDRAIDMRVSYEMTFFMDDTTPDQGELTFRLALRAARLLGASPAERDRIFDLGRKLYALTSRAVHTGTFELNDKTIQILKDGAIVIRRALNSFARNGVPDWRQLMLD